MKSFTLPLGTKEKKKRSARLTKTEKKKKKRERGEKSGKLARFDDQFVQLN